MNFKALTRFFDIFKPEFHIYTDGSQKGKWGSWAFVITQGENILHEASGCVSKANSNRMEFQAAIEALRYVKAGTKARLYSDSRILINAVNSANERPQANEDQLAGIDELIADRQITWIWVKAHAGNRFNERCDELCVRARTNK